MLEKPTADRIQEGGSGKEYQASVEIFNKKMGNFPGGPVVKTSHFNAGGVGLIPDL